MDNKKDEINNLNNQINNLKKNNFDNINVKRNEIITVLFQSIDQKVNMPYSCISSDIFVRIEEFLYNEYPEYKDYNTYFTVNGKIVKRFRSIKENNIKNMDKILLNIYE